MASEWKSKGTEQIKCKSEASFVSCSGHLGNCSVQLIYQVRTESYSVLVWTKKKHVEGSVGVQESFGIWRRQIAERSKLAPKKVATEVNKNMTGCRGLDFPAILKSSPRVGSGFMIFLY